MTTMVTGVYKQGRIELLDPPAGLREGQVRVLLIQDQGPKPEPQYLVFGKYAGGKDITLEDFEDAEWHKEPEFDGLDGE